MFRRYAQHSNALERVLCVRISHSLVVAVSGVVVGIKTRRMKLLSTTNTANRGATADDDRSPQLCDTACATRTHRGDSTRSLSDAGPPPSLKATRERQDRAERPGGRRARARERRRRRARRPLTRPAYAPSAPSEARRGCRDRQAPNLN